MPRVSRKIFAIFIGLFLAWTLAACGLLGIRDPEIPAKDSILERMKAMTLEEKVGQILLAGIDGTSLKENDKARQLIGSFHVGGVILYGDNVKGTDQLLSFLNELKKENTQVHGEDAIPLFLSVDEEGGRITRMPKEFTRLPSSQEIGKKNEQDLAYSIGKLISKEVSSFGYNMVFAPVLDINSNPNNPVIGDRSFGDNAEIVTSLGIKTMEGIQYGRVMSVIKHFPGHGDTSEDSHIGLPKVTKTLSDLRKFELVPFKTAVEKGADAVMIAHILLPKIDPAYPSSLSKKMITDLLRSEMGFKGVVITDDLTMGAITRHYSLGQAAVRSFLAGSDILLVAHRYENVVEVFSAIKKAVEEGKITERRLDESLYRILRLKEKYGLNDLPAQEVNVKAINDEIKELLEK